VGLQRLGQIEIPRQLNHLRLDVKSRRAAHARPADSSLSPTDATTVLQALAKRLADSYIAHAQPRAILLVGSAATGDADEYSDLDMLV
jgi:hypothetical protein